VAKRFDIVENSGVCLERVSFETFRVAPCRSRIVILKRVPNSFKGCFQFLASQYAAARPRRMDPERKGKKIVWQTFAGYMSPRGRVIYDTLIAKFYALDGADFPLHC
jgi:hypothetical protein